MIETTATAPAEAPEASAPETSFADRFAAFQANESKSPEPAAPAAPEPTPVAEAPEPKHSVTNTPLDTVETPKDDKSFNLPIDSDDMDDTAEPSETDGSDLPSNIKEGTPQAMAFRTLRKEKQEIARQRDAFQAELDQIKARSTELEGERTIREELEQRVKEYEAKLNITRIEESPVFQKAVSEPARVIGEKTAAIAEQYGIDLNNLDAVFDIADEMKRKQGFKELLSGIDIDPEDNLELRAMAKEYRTIVAKKAEILANSEKTLAELEVIQTKQAEREAAIRAEERRGTTKQIGEHITRKLPVLKTLANFDYDAVVGEVAETDLTALDTQNQAYNTIAGKALPKLAKAYGDAMKQVEAMSDELEKIRRSSPRPGGSMPMAPGGTASGAEGGDFLDRFKKTFGS